MNIALLGYGRMGKAIEQIALERGHQIVYFLDKDLEEGDIRQAQVAINFSIPSAAVTNIKMALEQQLPVICGTTGWLEHLTAIETLCKKKKGAFLYASNFSVGVNLFFKLTRSFAQLMAPQKAYEATLTETHHIHKLDAPSGTAITLAEHLLEHSAYTQWTLGEAKEKQLAIKALREGEVPGTHSIEYRSEIDALRITHEAFNRKGFALGAVIASEWIVGKTGIFSMEDVLNLS